MLRKYHQCLTSFRGSSIDDVQAYVKVLLSMVLTTVDTWSLAETSDSTGDLSERILRRS